MDKEAADVQVIFFDVRDTLGEVDRPGHLVPYRPSTEQLLEAVNGMGVKLGVITNLPDDVSDEQGRNMVCDAVLSQDEKTGEAKTIGRFIPREHIVTNHQASKALGTKVNKPFKDIYQFAAKTLGVEPSGCLFVGENLNEVLGAEIAGMRARRKECPPG